MNQAENRFYRQPERVVRIGVVLAGCDDRTCMVIDATAAERAFLERLAALSAETATSCCQPRLGLVDADVLAAEIRELEDDD